MTTRQTLMIRVVPVNDQLIVRDPAHPQNARVPAAGIVVPWSTYWQRRQDLDRAVRLEPVDLKAENQGAPSSAKKARS